MEPTTNQTSVQAAPMNAAPVQNIQPQQIALSPRIGFWPRVGATLLDAVICTVIGGIVGATVGLQIGIKLYSYLGGVLGSTTADPSVTGALSGLGGALVAMTATMVFIALLQFLNSLLDGLFGATLGKMALGLRIKNADGSKASAAKLWGRYALKNIAYIGLIVSIITREGVYTQIASALGLVIVLGFLGTLGASKQALHDLVCKTAVYKK